MKAQHGARLLQAAACGDPVWAPYVSWVLRQGADREDFVAWWDMSDRARRRTEHALKAQVIAFYVRQLELSGDTAAAVQATKLAQPIYGVPEDDDRECVTGDDRRLPVELSSRVARWQRRSAQVRDDLVEAGHTSFNALVRAEIRAGRL